jgi:nicotinamide-nucleotide amidase
MAEPRAVLVCVGDELLAGLVVNTNAVMIGELLLAAGVPVVRSVCVGDDEAAISAEIRRGAAEAGLVVVTGGLGPTQDDRTREALALLLGTELVLDEDALASLRQRFADFGRDMPPSNAKQALVPQGADAIPNPWGTAPGLRAILGDAVVVAIPGVPGEARRMLTERIIPELTSHAGAAIRTVDLRCCGLPESELADRLADLAIAENPRLAFLPGGGEVRVRFVASGPTGASCDALLDAARRAVRDRLGEVCYGEGVQTLEVVVGRMLTERRRTLSVAESCTGGGLAARISSVPGASNYFAGGIVTYMTKAKARNLGLDESLLDRPVSEEVTREMTRRVREVFGTDHALAVTCAAGPDPQGDAAVGTTYLGHASAGDLSVVGLKLPGDRDQVRLFAATFALNLLRLRLLREG